jgi:hypothetical protein
MMHSMTSRHLDIEWLINRWKTLLQTATKTGMFTLDCASGVQPAASSATGPVSKPPNVRPATVIAQYGYLSRTQ